MFALIYTGQIKIEMGYFEPGFQAKDTNNGIYTYIGKTSCVAFEFATNFRTVRINIL